MPSSPEERQALLRVRAWLKGMLEIGRGVSSKDAEAGVMRGARLLVAQMSAADRATLRAGEIPASLGPEAARRCVEQPGAIRSEVVQARPAVLGRNRAFMNFCKSNRALIRATTDDATAVGRCLSWYPQSVLRQRVAWKLFSQCSDEEKRRLRDDPEFEPQPAHADDDASAQPQQSPATPRTGRRQIKDLIKIGQAAVDVANEQLETPEKLSRLQKLRGWLFEKIETFLEACSEARAKQPALETRSKVRRGAIQGR